MKPMTLHALRLWHWHKVQSLGATALSHDAYTEAWEKQNAGHLCRSSRNKARDYHRNANFHLGAVQALNDVLPGTTAEQDAAREAAHA